MTAILWVTSVDYQVSKLSKYNLGTGYHTEGFLSIWCCLTVSYGNWTRSGVDFMNRYLSFCEMLVLFSNLCFLLWDGSLSDLSHGYLPPPPPLSISFSFQVNSLVFGERQCFYCSFLPNNTTQWPGWVLIVDLSIRMMQKMQYTQKGKDWTTTNLSKKTENETNPWSLCDTLNFYCH